MPTNRRYGGDDTNGTDRDPAEDNDRVDDLVRDADDAVTVEKSDDDGLLGEFDISKSDRDTDVPSLDDAYRGISRKYDYPNPGTPTSGERAESVDVGRSRTGRRDASKADDEGDGDGPFDTAVQPPEGPGDGLSDDKFADLFGDLAAAATDDDTRDALEAVVDYTEEHGRPDTVGDVVAWVALNDGHGTGAAS